MYDLAAPMPSPKVLPNDLPRSNTFELAHRLRQIFHLVAHRPDGVNRHLDRFDDEPNRPAHRPPGPGHTVQGFPTGVNWTQ